MTATSATISADVTAIQTAWDAIPSFDQATSDDLANLSTLIAAALADVTSLLAIADADFSNSGAEANFASGTNPLTMIANLNRLDNASDSLIALVVLQARLARMAQTVAGVTT